MRETVKEVKGLFEVGLPITVEPSSAPARCLGGDVGWLVVMLVCPKKASGSSANPIPFHSSSDTDIMLHLIQKHKEPLWVEGGSRLGFSGGSRTTLNQGLFVPKHDQMSPMF